MMQREPLTDRDRLDRVAVLRDEALDTWRFSRPEDYRVVQEWLGRLSAVLEGRDAADAVWTSADPTNWERQ